MSIFNNLTFFVIAGFQKSGTTYLHRILSQHPEILLTRQKELNFFNNLNARNYEDYFRPNKQTRAYGDISPQYSYLYSAKYIYNYRSDTKIIFIIRDKFDRTISHYKMQVNKQEEVRTFEEILSLEEESITSRKFATEYFHNSDYENQIRDFENHFKDILYIHHADLLKTPEVQLRKILNFINADEEFIFENITSRVHVGGKQRFPRLNIIKKKLIRFLKPYKDLIFKIVSSDIIYGILHRFETEWNISVQQNSENYEIFRNKVNQIFNEKKK